MKILMSSLKVALLLILFLIFDNCKDQQEFIDRIKMQYVSVNGMDLAHWARGSNKQNIIIFIPDGPGISCVEYDRLHFLRDLATNIYSYFFDPRGVITNRNNLNFSDLSLKV